MKACKLIVLDEEKVIKGSLRIAKGSVSWLIINVLSTSDLRSKKENAPFFHLPFKRLKNH